MQSHFDTQTISSRQRVDYWQDAVCNTYFPLQLSIDAPLRARLSSCSFEGHDISLSCLRSSPATYTRLSTHIHSGEAPCYLVTMPCLSGIHFEQGGELVRCLPGSFIVERSDLPYRFGHERFNQVLVLKIPESAVRNRIGCALRTPGLAFNSAQGLGRLFFEKIRTLHDELPLLDAAAQEAMLGQLIESFCLVLQNDARVLASQSPALADFHLGNIGRFIERHLADPELTPEKIAQGCHISVRYLYKLLAAQNLSPKRLLYQKRLDAVYRQLCDLRVSTPIGVIAYAHGFNDQAHFSRLFRARYGLSPSALRRQAALAQ